MNKNVLKGSIISTVFLTAVFAFTGVASAATTWTVDSNSGTTTCVAVTDETCKTIQAAITAAVDGDTVNVVAGTYVENVAVSKAITLVSVSGAASTNIVATDANSTPLSFTVSGATVNGFTITHSYTPSELSTWNFNNNGVLFNQGTTGNTLTNSIISLNRNGVYVNNASVTLTGNTITNNRTGLNFTNTYDGSTITGNTISNNWTVGFVTYTATPGMNTDFSTVTMTGNTFDQNWYSEIVIKDAGNTGTLNVTNNTFTDSPVTFTTSSSASLNEPGFGAQQPVALGGTATKPANELPTLRIYNSASATLGYTNAKTLKVGSSQAYTTIQSAINDAAAGDTVIVDAGTYSENVNITKALTLKGAQYGVAVSGRTFADGSESTVSGVSNGTGAIWINASGVTVDGFSITDAHALFASFGVVVKSTGSNSTISNNIIDTITSADTGGNGTAQGIYLENGPDAVQILSNKINNIHSNRSAKGVLVGANGASDPSTDVLIQGNTITNVTSDARGAYGISNGTATPGHSNLQIKNNTITTLNGAWAHAIGLEGDTPNAVVTGNTISGLTVGALSTDSTAVRVESNPSSASITLSNNSFDTTTMVYGVTSAVATNLDASKNFWNNGNVDPSSKTATSSTGTITVSPWYADSGMTTLTNGVTITTTATSTDSDTSGGVTTTTTVAAGTEISGDSTWNGVVENPTVVASQGVTPSSNNMQTSTILTIEVGSTQSQLTLSKAAKLVFSGQAGKLVAWSFGGTSHPITATCDSSVVDEPTATASLAAGADCKMDVAGDLVVWTKHFTLFSVYTETAATVSGGGGGGGGGNGPVVGGGGGGSGVVALPNNGGGQTSGSTGTTGSTGSTGGQVLGASTFNFTSDLTIGSRGNQVIELQKFLIAQGFTIPSIANDTATYGYFGSETRAALAAYQRSHGITPAVGYFGPITRALINVGSTPTMTTEQRTALIASLLAQVQVLQTKLNAMIAAGQH